MLSLGNNIVSSSSVSRELIVNGSFSIASGAGVGWTANGGATTTGGVGFLNDDPGSSLTQSILTIGKVYNYSLIAKSPDPFGNLKISDDAGAHVTISNVPATFTEYTGSFTAGHALLILHESSSGDITIDNVSITEA
tara:strand:- start:180 stop:590 length:411 start_codon:yes stop_codon:yes gene_type:complete